MATPSPAAVAELLARLDKDSVPAETGELAFYLEAATEAAEGWHNTGPIVTRAFVEQAETTGLGTLLVHKRPVVAVTSVTHISSGGVTLGAELAVDTEAGIITGLGFRLTAGGYTVSYTAGRGVAGAVPAQLKMAVLLIAEHNWQAKRGPRTRAFRGEGGRREEIRAANGFLIPRDAAGYLRSVSDPFLIG